MDKSKFKGILVPVISPIKPEGGVDLDAMEKVIRYVFSKGVDGLYVCGATGDGSYLRIPDRKAVAERAAKICKEYGKLCIINAGVKSTEESVELVKHAVAAGADAVSAMPVDRSNSIQRRNYYEKLAAAAGDTPFLLYYIPAVINIWSEKAPDAKKTKSDPTAAAAIVLLACGVLLLGVCFSPVMDVIVRGLELM